MTELFSRRGDDLVWTGNLPVRATRSLRDCGFDVRELLDGRSDR